MIYRASVADADAVAACLQAHTPPGLPASTQADIALFLGEPTVAVFCARLDDRIVGVAGCVSEGTIARLTRLAVDRSSSRSLFCELIVAAEKMARASGAVLIAARAPRDSDIGRRLRACGYEAGWQEADAALGRVVTMVDLEKLL